MTLLQLLHELYDCLPAIIVLCALVGALAFQAGRVSK